MATNLEPFTGRVLVEVQGEYANIAVSAVRWDSKKSGIVLKVADKDHQHLVGKRIWWDNFGTEVDDKYAFIKVEEIEGYE